MLQFVANQFYLIVLALFAAVSLVIIGLRRNHVRASVVADPRGVTYSLTAIAVCSALLALVNAVVAVAAFVPTSREGFFEQFVLLPFLFLAGLGSVAVLDSYAIWPSGSGKRGGAVARGLLSASFVVAGLFITASAAGRVAAVAERAVQAEESQAVEARSVALSMLITVVDAQLGRSTVNGRVVSHLTLDVTVRSTADIQLLQAEPGFGYHWINVAPPGTGFPIQPEVGLNLPTHIPAGSDRTYRLEVPIDDLRLEPADEFTTGTWTASLFLEGSGGAPGQRPMYETRTSFVVPDAP